MYYDDVCESHCSFHYFEQRKARKEHKCDECSRTIPIGDSYCHYISKWDDDFFVSDICPECDEDWTKVINIFHENGEAEAVVIFGRISEAIQDAIDEGFIEEDDPLAQKWLGVLEDTNEEEDGGEESATSQMSRYSHPLL